MALGIAVPIGVNSSGGLALVDGDDNDLKVIQVGLSDCDNDNAFMQDLGIGTAAIFDVNDPTARSQIITKVRVVFARLQAQNRFRLLENTIKWEEDGGELKLSFSYLNIESDKLYEFDRKYS